MLGVEAEKAVLECYSKLRWEVIRISKEYNEILMTLQTMPLVSGVSYDGTVGSNPNHNQSAPMQKIQILEASLQKDLENASDKLDRFKKLFKIEEKINLLTPEERDIFEMKHYECLSFKDIKQRLGTNSTRMVQERLERVYTKFLELGV